MNTAADLEHKIEEKLPRELLLVGIQHFPFKHHNVLNFFIQGITVFLIAALVGFEAGHHLAFVCN